MRSATLRAVRLMVGLCATLVAATAHAGPLAFIADEERNQIDVIDTANDTVVGTGISVYPMGAPTGVTLSPDGKTLYATLDGTMGSLAIIDAVALMLVGTVTVGASPYAAALSPDSAFAYVSNAKDDTVSIVDTTARAVVAVVPVGQSPQGIVVTADGTRVYVANKVSNTISVIDAACRTVTSTVTVAGVQPMAMTLTPDAQTIYLTGVSSSALVGLDIATDTVSAPIMVGTYPAAIAITPDGTHAYVANANDGTVSVVDLTAAKVSATINVGAIPDGVAVTPDGTQTLVTNANGDSLSVIDTASNQVTNTLMKVAIFPAGIVVTPLPHGPSDAGVGTCASDGGDAGLSDATTDVGADEDASTHEASSSGCGCQSAGQPGPRNGWVLALGLSFLVQGRRRQRR